MRAQVEGRGEQEGRQALDRRHRDPVPGEQGAAAREDRRAGAREDDRGHHRSARRVRPRRHAHRHRAASAAKCRRSCSTTSTSTRSCRRRSASSCWRSSAAGRRCCRSLDIIEHFIEFRREVVRRRTEFELRKAEARAHILEGLKIALDHLDEVIKLIRGVEEPGRGARRPDDAVRAVAGPVAGDPRHAAAAADRPRAAEDRRRAGRAAEDDRAAARDPRRATSC